jgi:hypothetical protein
MARLCRRHIPWTVHFLDDGRGFLGAAGDLIMGLTVVVNQWLRDAGLIGFYEQNPAPWNTKAQETYDFARNQYAMGVAIHRDDVAKSLLAFVECDESLKAFLAENGYKSF